MFLEEIFGEGTNTAFMRTTPRNFLFEGIEFCKNVTEFPELICSVVEEEESPNIWRVEGENSLRFAMFVHVSFVRHF
jgi:hypothetical protein